MNKDLQWPMTIVLFGAFCVMIFYSMSLLFEEEVGTKRLVEEGIVLPDFTLCPYLYTPNLIETINLKSNHNALALSTLLPSVRHMIQHISIFEVDVKSIDPYAETNYQPESILWENGTMIDDGISENDFWQDSLVIGTTPPFGMIRCSTIRWPSKIHFGINSYVIYI